VVDVGAISRWENVRDGEADGQLVVVTPDDYILGMSDLTGELMRYATNGQFPKPCTPRADG
jgi:predicted translin family RNA/ssDNA-binding protein